MKQELNKEEQEKRHELELNRLEQQISSINKSAFEIEKVLNEKFVYILAGTLALLFQGNHSIESFNWIYFFSVIYITAALLINIWGIFVSIDMFKKYKEVTVHNYSNYYGPEEKEEYPKTDFLLWIRASNLVLLTSGVILLVIYYLIY